MRNVQVVVWDYSKTGMEWLDLYAENLDVMELVSINGEDGTIPLSYLSENTSWEYLLIFEYGATAQITRLLELSRIPLDKVIFCYDTASLWEHKKAIRYMMNDVIKRMLDYLELGLYHQYIAVTVEKGISYLGRTTDQCIMIQMFITQKNWAADEMHHFFELSGQYYPAREGQKLFCDIGANIGTTCIYFKKCLDPSVNILAFEPMPETFQMLSMNVALNGLSESVTLERVGLSDEKADSLFHYNEKNPGGSSFVNDNSSHVSVTVSTVPFDDYLREKKIPPETIKYLWVDVEGFEAAFVKGAMNTLQTLSVPFVMEFTPFFLQKQGRFSELVENLKTLYANYIELSDPENTIHEINDLYQYADADSSFQKDLFLLK